jgi:hypothetical protein
MTVKDYFYTYAHDKSMTLKEVAEDVLHTNYKTFYAQIHRNGGMGLPTNLLVSYLEKTGGQLVLSTYDPPNEYLLDGEIEDYAYNDD